jgi:hypothetical protein
VVILVNIGLIVPLIIFCTITITIPPTSPGKNIPFQPIPLLTYKNAYAPAGGCTTLKNVIADIVNATATASPYAI